MVSQKKISNSLNLEPRKCTLMMKTYLKIFPEIQNYVFYPEISLTNNFEILDPNFLYKQINDDNIFKDLFHQFYQNIFLTSFMININKNNFYKNRNDELNFLELGNMTLMKSFNMNKVNSYFYYKCTPSKFMNTNKVETTLSLLFKETDLKVESNKYIDFYEVDNIINDFIAIESCGSPHSRSFWIDDDFHLNKKLTVHPFQILNYINVYDYMNDEQIAEYKINLEQLQLEITDAIEKLKSKNDFSKDFNQSYVHLKSR